MTIRVILIPLISLVLVMSTGCKEKKSDASTIENAIPRTEIDAQRKRQSAGLEKTSFDRIQTRHIGKLCLVEAETSKEAPSKFPPPLGMIYKMGLTTFYKAPIAEVSSDFIALEAKYPTSGKIKRVEITRDRIESIFIESK